nr:HD domain protein [uncultured bacterium]ALS91607.1 HD domain protein [uncultured bacterium]
MLSTLIELQRLKRLDRTGWVLRGQSSGTESVAAHSFGVAVTAMMLADEVRARGTAVDAERVLRMALLHDWAETRVGDMPKTAAIYFGSEARRQAETAAFADLVQGVGSAESAYKSLHADYETRDSLEARLVKAADIIDLLVQALAMERAGSRGLDEFWEILEKADFHLDGAAQEIVTEMLEALRTARREINS